MRILVTEALGEAGLSVLREAGEVDVRKGLSPVGLLEIIGGYDALVVRSATKVTAAVLNAGRQLRVVGRAGSGVDNIDVDAATERGIIVVNAPGGNANAVAEHTIALMLSLARHIYPAVNSLKAGRWEKSAFEGYEVKGKTLGLVGLGRIGNLVASKAKGLEMRVVAFDPYTSAERAASSGVDLKTLDEVLAEADFISVHTPMTTETRGLIGAERLARLKTSAYIINCARGGIIDEQALHVALAGKRLAGAALDVFAVEPATDNPLIALPNMVATPHLAGSTIEAQETVAIDVAHGIVDVLAGRIPASPVNVPYLPPKAVEFLQPYAALAQRMGSLFMQWRGELLGRVELIYEGQLCEYDTRLLTSAFAAGLLQSVNDEPVSIVNATRVAEQRGLEIAETRRGRREHFDNLIAARFPDPRGEYSIAGTLIQGEPHLVGLDGFRLDCVPQGRILVDLHHDRPGIVGALGQVLGQADINISFVQMSRASRGGAQIMMLGLDVDVPPDLMARLLEIPNILRVRMVNLPPLDGPQHE